MKHDSKMGSSASRWVQEVFARSRRKAFPKIKMPTFSVAGYDAAEVLLNLMSPEEIELLIQWVFANPFWSSIITSVSKLVKFLPAIQIKIEESSQDAQKGL